MVTYVGVEGWRQLLVKLAIWAAPSCEAAKNLIKYELALAMEKYQNGYAPASHRRIGISSYTCNTSSHLWSGIFFQGFTFLVRDPVTSYCAAAASTARMSMYLAATAGPRRLKISGSLLWPLGVSPSSWFSK